MSIFRSINKISIIVISAILLCFTYLSCQAQSLNTNKNNKDSDLYDFSENNSDFDVNALYSSHKSKYLDPLEPINRTVFIFNQAVDKTIINPLSSIYKTIIPEFGRSRVDNFLHNFSSPVILFNNILQGNVEEANTTFWRFVINTFLGLGINDIATELGLKYKYQDLSKTLAYYNIPSGPYLVLPILGPSSAIDFSGKIVDFVVAKKVINNNIMSKNIKKGIFLTKIIHYRAEYYNLIDNQINDSIDPYVTLRSIYWQNRNK